MNTLQNFVRLAGEIGKLDAADGINAPAQSPRFYALQLEFAGDAPENSLIGASLPLLEKWMTTWQPEMMRINDEWIRAEILAGRMSEKMMPLRYR